MSQTDSILRHLKKGRSVTPLMALSQWNCLRLAARIRMLREAGYKIETHTVKRNGKKFASYLMDFA